MFVFLLVMALIMPLTMVMFGLIWGKQPPKTINWAYGYRTTMSMKNRDTWEFAHKYMAGICKYCGIILTAATVILLLAFKDSSLYETILTIVLIAQVSAFLLAIIPVEIALHKNFDKDGKRKELTRG